MDKWTWHKNQRLLVQNPVYGGGGGHLGGAGHIGGGAGGHLGGAGDCCRCCRT